MKTDIISNITKEEKNAIWEWSLDSTKIKKAMWGKASNIKAKKEAEIIEKMFDKYKSNINAGTVLYRGKGISDDEWKDIYSKLEIGSKYSPDNLAVTSFSRDKNIAYGFAYDSEYNKKLLLKYVFHSGNLLDISMFSSMPNEEENILDKNIWYNVKEIEKCEEGGILWLKLEIEL